MQLASRSRKDGLQEMGQEVDTCEIGGQTAGVDFDDLMAAMQDDMYWIRFFARPCCPAPDLNGAVDMLDRLKAEARGRADLSEEQRSRLCDVIESRKEWYPTSGLCRARRS